jgi:hypothetical protein
LRSCHIPQCLAKIDGQKFLLSFAVIHCCRVQELAYPAS